MTVQCKYCVKQKHPKNLLLLINSRAGSKQVLLLFNGSETKPRFCISLLLVYTVTLALTANLRQSEAEAMRQVAEQLGWGEKSENNGSPP